MVRAGAVVQHPVLVGVCAEIGCVGQSNGCQGSGESDGCRRRNPFNTAVCCDIDGIGSGWFQIRYGVEGVRRGDDSAFTGIEAGLAVFNSERVCVAGPGHRGRGYADVGNRHVLRGKTGL